MVRPFLRWMTSAVAGSGAKSTRMKTRARTRQILSTAERGRKVTKVLELGRQIVGLASLLLFASAGVHAAGPTPDCPQTTDALYSRIRSVGPAAQQVYRIRDASIDRPNLHLDFEDGTLAFIEDICGRVTGAFFVGEGEIRLRPPNRVERGSMALFTGMAILEEQFTSAYLRFNDDTAAALKPFLSPATDSAELIKDWSDAIQSLAEFDALRLLLDFSHFLPEPHGRGTALAWKFPALLHARLQGKKL